MRRWMAVVAVVALAGCVDTDGDGTRDGRDCAPGDKDVHPGAEEICNGRDDNCNGQIDEDVAIVAFWDRDLDGFGDAAFARRVCKLPEDGTTVSGDCDDHDPQVHPDAAELCDQVDNDCDGEIDEDATPITFYADVDGDGFGDPGATVSDCIAPPGYVGNDLDCDDGDPTAWEGAVEACDGVDNDCDGSIDEDLPDVRVWVDDDGDGSGDPGSPALACGALPGFSLDDRDCDDTDPNLGGSAVDIQGNGIDEDCDGYVDEYGIPVPFADFGAAVNAIGIPTGAEVVQFDDGWHNVNVDMRGLNIILAGEGCERTTLYAAAADPVVKADVGRIEGLSLVGGTAASGGGLRVDGGSVVAVGICVEDNAANLRGGGVAVMNEGSLVLEDSRVAHNSAGEIGGGIYADYNTYLEVVRTEVLANEATILWGGGIGVRGGHAEVHNSIIAGNHAIEMGGGIYVANGLGPTGPGGTDVHYDGSANIQYTSLHANRIDPVAGLQGSALLVGGTVVDLNESTLTGHEDFASIATKSATLMPGEFRLPFIFTRSIGIRGNESFDITDNWILGSERGDPSFVNIDPTLDPTEWDLRIWSDSAWIDASSDPAVYQDVDGSPADIGAWGGPRAWWDETETPLWRPRLQPESANTIDVDADGLLDAWEDRWGTSTWVDDAGLDLDGDGLDNAAEQALGTDPLAADTDLDGVDDDVEDAAGTDPTAPADHRPVADAGPDTIAMVGLPVQLSGLASRDPNGDPLTYAWSVVGAPFGSTAAFAVPTDPIASFTADLPGRYTLQLEVSDGGAFHRVTRWVEARTGVIVPDDAATPQDALGMVYDGQGIFVRAGTWPGIDLTGREVVVAGLDPADAVVLDAAGAGSVVTVDSGSVMLASLTLTGGDADGGGAIHVDGADDLTLRNLVIRDNVAGHGGGVWVYGTDVDAAWLEVHDNEAGEGGGVRAEQSSFALHSSRLYRNSAWEGGAFWLDQGPHAMRNVEIQTNSADRGGAFWIHQDGILHLDNAAIAGNRGGAAIWNEQGLVFTRGVLWIEDEGVGEAIHALDGTNPTTWRVMYGLNGGDDDFWYNTTSGAARAWPMGALPSGVLSWIDDGDPDTDLLIPGPGSLMIDKGWPDFLDPDGSPSDIGPGGGPGAAALGRGGQWDHDGDGMADAWEERFGLDPSDPSDASTDTDGDGWTALDEFIAATNPNAADSDGDGLDDPSETTTDPHSFESVRPKAIVSTGFVSFAGVSHDLIGSASFDPMPGPAPLAYQWRLIQAPAGSTLTTADITDPTGAVTDFVPDVGGCYVFGLVVTDGLLTSHEAILLVEPRDQLTVPAMYATAEDAMAVAQAGDAILLQAGIHDVHLTTWVDGVTILGEGVDQTFVHGLPGLPIFELDSGESATIRDLTLAGANGNYGGALDCAYSTVTLQDVRFEWNASHDGGALRSWFCDATLTDVDFLDNDASSRGGAAMFRGGSFTWTRGEVARNSADGVGGGIIVDNSLGLIRNVVFHHNFTESGGGAVHQQSQWNDPVNPLDDADDADPVGLVLEHVTVAGNNGRYGALYLAMGEVRNSIVQQNANDAFYKTNTEWYAIVDASYNAVWGNQTGVGNGTDLNISGTTAEDARFVSFDPFDGGGWTADFHLPLASPVRNTGSVLSGLDPDGTLPDPGAYGGPNAPQGWNAWQVDGDGDGMSDRWEMVNGLDPMVADAGLDADGDGLTNLDEHDAFLNPQSTDSDGDGWLDQDEQLDGGSNPANALDHGPVAVAGNAQTGGLPGVPRGFNGGASFDPDSDPITAWSWSLVGKPGRSTLTTGDLSGATGQIVTLTPDFPGTYELQLVITAGGVPSLPSRTTLSVRGTVLVPEDYASVADAIDAVDDGSTVDVGPGTWPTVALLGGKDVTVVGAGRDQTILDGEGRGTVIRGDLGEQLEVRDLTITGGLASEGGALHMEGAGGFVDLYDVTLQGNGSLYGGAVYVRSGTLQTTRSRIVDNHSGRNGGGIYATASTVDLTHTLLAGNLAVALHGGGINHYNGPLTITNSILHDNWTDEHGGALYVNGIDSGGLATTDVWMDQVAITQNYSEVQGGAFKFFKANVTILNAIVAHNRGGGAAIHNQGDINTFTARYLLVEGNDAHFELSQNPTIVVPSDGDADGNLVDRPADLSGLSEDGDWTNDDWALGPASAGIDAGDPAVTDSDGSACDLGPYGGPQGAWTP